MAGPIHCGTGIHGWFLYTGIHEFMRTFGRGAPIPRASGRASGRHERRNRRHSRRTRRRRRLCSRCGGGLVGVPRIANGQVEGGLHIDLEPAGNDMTEAVHRVVDGRLHVQVEDLIVWRPAIRHQQPLVFFFLILDFPSSTFSYFHILCLHICMFACCSGF
jgi:hypothetical protein